MELIQAVESDLAELAGLYQRVADQMERDGLRQWHWGVYPSEEMLADDIRKGELYIQRMDGAIAAAVVLTEKQDPVYDEVPWTGGLRPGYFHRLVVDPSLQGAGLGGGVLDDAAQILRRRGCDCLRCDTHVRNDRARRLYRKMGFRACGGLSWADTPGEAYLAFDKPLKRETPIWPIRMVPAFRSGEMTPWGGEKLRTDYGKACEDSHTGESMEVSCIPGLESRDGMGRKLPELIREFGEKLAGKYADRPFPLLLKLIDARETLSVQVHPNDEYAAANEGGKLGKTEAWLILDAPENSEIVYGLVPGTEKRELKEACLQGKAVEKLLRRVRVQTGDLCYIPAGCVHAIGAGIVLYEIQESSDLTYRLYDWDRVNEKGEKRELHLDKSLDVADVRCLRRPVRVEKAYGTKRVLNETAFTLDLIRPGGAEVLPEIRDFGILTVLEGDLSLCWKGGRMFLGRGETCLLPKDGLAMSLRGSGTAVLAMPNG